MRSSTVNGRIVRYPDGEPLHEAGSRSFGRDQPITRDINAMPDGSILDLASRATSTTRPCALYFSAVGGTMSFSRRYVDSSAYCSLSCEAFPHAIPIRDRFLGPAPTCSVMFASVNDP